MKWNADEPKVVTAGLVRLPVESRPSSAGQRLYSFWPHLLSREDEAVRITLDQQMRRDCDRWWQTYYKHGEMLPFPYSMRRVSHVAAQFGVWPGLVVKRIVQIETKLDLLEAKRPI